MVQPSRLKPFKQPLPNNVINKSNKRTPPCIRVLAHRDAHKNSNFQDHQSFNIDILYKNNSTLPTKPVIRA